MARDGENLEHRLDRVQHLRAVGRNGDALALARPQLRDPNAAALASEEGMWLVNEAAYALLDLGRPAEAASLMRGLTRLPVADHLYLISSIINGEIRSQPAHGILSAARLLERDFAQHSSVIATCVRRDRLLFGFARPLAGAAPVGRRCSPRPPSTCGAGARLSLPQRLDSAERLSCQARDDDPN